MLSGVTFSFKLVNTVLPHCFSAWEWEIEIEN